MITLLVFLKPNEEEHYLCKLTSTVTQIQANSAILTNPIVETNKIYGRRTAKLLKKKRETLRILATGDVYQYHEVQNPVVRLSRGQLEEKSSPKINVIHSQDSLKPVLAKR